MFRFCDVLVSDLNDLEYGFFVHGQAGEGIFAETLVEGSK